MMRSNGCSPAESFVRGSRWLRRSRRAGGLTRGLAIRFLVISAAVFPANPTSAEQLFQLRNGLAIRGVKLEMASLKEGFAAAGDQNGARPVWRIDDGLRRHYIHGRGMTVGQPVDVGDLGTALEFWQPEPNGGRPLGELGDWIAVSPFNDFGRRIVTLRGAEGPVRVIQGLTEINPRFGRLAALRGKPSLLWDMRIATAALDSETILRIFRRTIDATDLDERLGVVRFLTDAERYGEAHAALREVIDDFPDRPELPPLLISLADQQGRQLLDEAKRRRRSGQFDLAERILRGFPLDAVGRVRRIEVQEELSSLLDDRRRVTAIVDELQRLASQLEPIMVVDRDEGDAAEAVWGPRIEEVRQHLSPTTLDRFADLERLAADRSLAADRKLALGLGGWLAGGGFGEQNLALVDSAFRVRDEVAGYLSSDDAKERKERLRRIRAEEAGTPRWIAAMLPLMRPARTFDDAPGSDETIASDDPVPGPAITGHRRVRFEDPGGGPTIEYEIQLPPGYDPDRSYPTVVSLGPPRLSAEAELAWWCGAAVPGGGGEVASSRTLTSLTTGEGDSGATDGPAAERSTEPAAEPDRPDVETAGEGIADVGASHTVVGESSAAERRGHAGRHGVIVLVPRWGQPGQRDYRYTAAEQHRVLASLRHAMRRCSIDADRVFVAGHGPGATAAWDIAISHPDVWSGLIGICPTPDKTIPHYERNARYLPKYIVFGQLDPGRPDGAIMDDYLSFRHDAMLVEYRGRGRESFYDELPRIMRWIDRPANRRPPMPTEFEVATMRSTDRQFWWLQLDDVNEAVTIDPVLWDADRIRAGTVTAAINNDNQIRVSVPAAGFRLWLRPMPGLDLNADVTVRRGTRNVRYEFDNDVETMLEDVRRRADRRRPFWMTIDPV